jgi:hypothetical protein
VTHSDPDPATAAGLEPGAGVSPGDTPPATGSESGAAPDLGPNHGPVSGNRTPMIVFLSVLGVIVLLSAGFVVASLFAS